MEDKKFELLKEKERQGKADKYELRKLRIEEDRRYEEYINSLIDKEERTEEEEEELDRYNEMLMRSEFGCQL